MNVAKCTDDVQRAAESDAESVLTLASDLVRVPSRANEDDYDHVVSVAEDWLTRHDVVTRRLIRDGRLVGLATTAESARRRTLVLDACLDTAPFGNLTDWESSPTSGEVVDGWLRGRGSADSKTGAAIFCHLTARLSHEPAGVSLLLDCDEHSGGFGGVRAFLDEQPDVAGVMIGYPGNDAVVRGGRGFLRTRITVYGVGAHSGGTRNVGVNAVSKGARLVQTLESWLPTVAAPTDFGPSPRVTVTAIHGGQANSFSVVPSRCTLSVDVRLTLAFDAGAALMMIRDACLDVDRQVPSLHPTKVRQVGESWPAYRLPDDSPLLQSLVVAAREIGEHPITKVAGPSNIGNYLATQGIPATAGFGVGYRGLHGPNEAVDTSTVPMVQAIYHKAALRFLKEPL